MTAKDFVNTWQIEAVSEQIDQNPNNEDWKDANHYKVTLRFNRGGKIRSYITHFSKGLALQGKPRAAEVIECLSQDINRLQDRGNFEDWAEDYGYDTDSRKAEKLYRVIQKQAQDLENWLSVYPNAWKQFQHIQEEE